MLILCSVSSLLSLPAFVEGLSSGNWFVWDYLAIFAPPILWIALTARGVGQQSLSHVVELFGLVVLMPVLVSVRVFTSEYIPLQPSNASFSIFALGVATALVLRIAMPHLPE